MAQLPQADNEFRGELTQGQIASIRRLYQSPDYHDGLIPLLRIMQAVEGAKLDSAIEPVAIYRAQGGKNRIKVLLDFIHKLAKVRDEQPEREPNG